MCLLDFKSNIQYVMIFNHDNTNRYFLSLLLVFSLFIVLSFIDDTYGREQRQQFVHDAKFNYLKL